MSSLFEPDTEAVAPTAAEAQAEQPQQPQPTVVSDKKSAAAGTAVNTPAGGVGQELKMKPEDEEQPLPPGLMRPVRWWTWRRMSAGGRSRR